MWHKVAHMSTDERTSNHVRTTPKYYTPVQVADILGIHVATLKRWEIAGKVPPAPRTLGGHRRYKQDDVDAIKTLMRDET